MSASAAQGGVTDGVAVASLVTVGTMAAENMSTTEQTMVEQATVEQAKMVAVQRTGVAKGWQVVRGGARRTGMRGGAGEGLREATSGRAVTLPRVWAVAAPAGADDAAATRPVMPEVAFYRKYTEALLGHYAHAKLAAGRAPSPMGNDVVRGHATHTRVSGFDDTLHFCIDVERCLELLDPTEVKLLRRVAIQGYSHEETATSLGMTVTSGFRRYGRALDEMTKLLIERKLLDPARAVKL